jgi:tetratricopeptide (TPR) repeat protein
MIRATKEALRAMAKSSRPHSSKRRVRPLPQPPTARRRPAVFLSLPDLDHLKTYADVLTTSICSAYARLRVVSYLGLRQGDWRVQLVNQIMLSNVVIGFLEQLNSNVLFELGVGLAMGKPMILVAPRGTGLPAMVSQNQVLWYSGKNPTDQTLKEIMEALGAGVFRTLHRETVDERTELQKNLLIGGPERKGYGLPHGRTRRDQVVLDRAEKYYRAGDLEAAAEVLQARVEEGTRDEGVFHTLADTCFLRGEGVDDPIAAKACYRECLRIAARGLKLSRRDSFLLQKDEALALAKLGQLDRAETRFLALRLVESQDRISLIDYNLACVYAQMRKKFLALEYLEAALYAKDYYRQLAWVDPDFDALWSDAMFQALVFRT